jgi:hypothetical protein
MASTIHMHNTLIALTITHQMSYFDTAQGAAKLIGEYTSIVKLLSRLGRPAYKVIGRFNLLSEQWSMSKNGGYKSRQSQIVTPMV